MRRYTFVLLMLFAGTAFAVDTMNCTSMEQRVKDTSTVFVCRAAVDSLTLTGSGESTSREFVVNWTDGDACYRWGHLTDPPEDLTWPAYQLLASWRSQRQLTVTAHKGGNCYELVDVSPACTADADGKICPIEAAAAQIKSEDVVAYRDVDGPSSKCTLNDGHDIQNCVDVTIARIAESPPTKQQSWLEAKVTLVGSDACFVLDRDPDAAESDVFESKVAMAQAAWINQKRVSVTGVSAAAGKSFACRADRPNDGCRCLDVLQISHQDALRRLHKSIKHP